MDAIIAREWIKYLPYTHIRTIALIGPDYARAIRAYLPEIIVYISIRGDGNKCVKALIRAGKNDLLEKVVDDLCLSFYCGSWAMKLGNGEFVKHCIKNGNYLIHLLYEEAILARDSAICACLEKIAYTEAALNDFNFYWRLKGHEDEPEEVAYRILVDSYCSKAAKVSYLPAFEKALSVKISYNFLIFDLGKNTNAEFVSQVLHMHRKHMSSSEKMDLFEAASDANNHDVMALFADILEDFDEHDQDSIIGKLYRAKRLKV